MYHSEKFLGEQGRSWNHGDFSIALLLRRMNCCSSRGKSTHYICDSIFSWSFLCCFFQRIIIWSRIEGQKTTDHIMEIKPRSSICILSSFTSTLCGGRIGILMERDHLLKLFAAEFFFTLSLQESFLVLGNLGSESLLGAYNLLKHAKVVYGVVFVQRLNFLEHFHLLPHLFDIVGRLVKDRNVELNHSWVLI